MIWYLNGPKCSDTCKECAIYTKQTESGTWFYDDEMSEEEFKALFEGPSPLEDL